MPRKQTFSTTELGLLDAIHAEPRSDELRLIYADWLEASGQQDHAEVIRLQCTPPHMRIRIGRYGPPSRVRVQPAGDGIEREFVRAARLHNLLAGLYKRLFRPVPKGANQSGSFNRGLPVYFVCLTDEDTTTADRLPGLLHPRARLSLCITTANLPEWCHNRVMSRAESVKFVPNCQQGKRAFDADDLEAVAASSIPDRVERLWFMSLTDQASEQYGGEMMRRCPESYPWGLAP